MKNQEPTFKINQPKFVGGPLEIVIGNGKHISLFFRFVPIIEEDLPPVGVNRVSGKENLVEVQVAATGSFTKKMGDFMATYIIYRTKGNCDDKIQASDRAYSKAALWEVETLIAMVARIPKSSKDKLKSLIESLYDEFFHASKSGEPARLLYKRLVEGLGAQENKGGYELGVPHSQGHYLRITDGGQFPITVEKQLRVNLVTPSGFYKGGTWLLPTERNLSATSAAELARKCLESQIYMPVMKAVDFPKNQVSNETMQYLSIFREWNDVGDAGLKEDIYNIVKAYEELGDEGIKESLIVRTSTKLIESVMAEIGYLNMVAYVNNADYLRLVSLM